MNESDHAKSAHYKLSQNILIALNAPPRYGPAAKFKILGAISKFPIFFFKMKSKVININSHETTALRADSLHFNSLFYNLMLIGYYHEW